MELKEKDIDLLESYLKGTLDPEQSARIEQRRREDTSFDNEVKELQILFSGIYTSGRKELREMMTEWDRTINEKGEVKVRRLSTWYYLAAASITIVMLSVVVLNLFKKPNLEQLASEAYEVYPSVAYSPQRGAASEDIMLQAFRNYDNGRYREFLAETKNLDPQEFGGVLTFYRASAHQALKEYTEAIQLYQEEIESTGTFYTQSLWYQALCFLYLNKKNKAQDNLKVLAEGSSSYASKASDLISKLD